jgi:hypothetical protein
VNDRLGLRGRISGSRLRTPAPGGSVLVSRARRRRDRARRLGQRRWFWGGLAGALAALGTTLITAGVLAQETPPAPSRDLGTIPAPGSLSPGSLSSADSGAAPAAPATLALPRSQPVSVAIPAIGVHASLIDLGLTADGGLQVPPLTAAGVKEAGWYDLGPAPGQVGPAVIAGHVDSYAGPGVFFRLGALKPGNRIDIALADGTTAVFQVNAVDEYRKTSFPAQQVYGPVSYAGLRVITCGGQFDYQTHHYRSNIVIYASLTGSRE